MASSDPTRPNLAIAAIAIMGFIVLLGAARFAGVNADLVRAGALVWLLVFGVIDLARRRWLRRQ